LICLYDYDEQLTGSIPCADNINMALPFEWALLGIEFLIVLFAPDKWILIFVLPLVGYNTYKYFVGKIWVKQEELHEKSGSLKIECFVKVGLYCLTMFCYFFCFVRDIIYLAQQYTSHMPAHSSRYT
jgi:hypothetical protein